MSMKIKYVGFLLLGLLLGCSSNKKASQVDTAPAEPVKVDVCAPLMEQLKTSLTGTDEALLTELKKKKEQCLSRVEQMVSSDNKDSGDINTLKNAVRLLGVFADPASINSLVLAVESENLQLRAVAINSLKSFTLEQLGDVPAQMLKNEDFKVRSAIVEILKSFKDPTVIPLLIKSLGDKHGGVRNGIYNAISSLGKPATTALLTEFNDENSSVDKRLLIVALGRTGDPDVVDVLLGVMQGSEIKLKNAAACALAEIKDSRTVKPLLSALSDINPPVRACAAKALGNQDDKTIVPNLIKTLKSDEHSQVQAMAAYSLGKLKDNRAVATIIHGLKSESRSVRYHCVAALSNFSTPAIVAPLASVLADKDVRIHAISTLVRLGKLSVPVMIKSLKSSNPDVVAGAAAVLGRIKDETATKPLIAVLDGNSDKEVASQVEMALRLITGQNLGSDVEAWNNWIKNNG